MDESRAWFEGPDLTLARAVEVVDRLEAGEGPAAVANAMDLGPAALVALIAREALGAEGDLGPSLVQAAPRRPRLAASLSEPALSALFPQATRPRRLALAAGLWQVHDFWDLSHQAAQEADDLGESETSAYWHGIAHRREPDAGNASYWFRRVGRHPVFDTLARRAAALADGAGGVARLTPGGAWDPFAFIEFCTRARGDDVPRARRLQREEMLVLLAATVPA